MKSYPYKNTLKTRRKADFSSVRDRPLEVQAAGFHAKKVILSVIMLTRPAAIWVIAEALTSG